MSTTIPITCPQCETQLKGPADLVGKKIRCKSCAHVFVVSAPAPVAATPAKAKAKKPPDDAPIAFKDEPSAKPAPVDDDDDKTPYGITAADVAHRCPRCAAEMSEGDRVCLECGYNTMTRTLTTSKKVYEQTGNDVFLWLLPGIGCVVAIVVLLILDVVVIVYTPSFVEYMQWAEPGEPWKYFNPISLWSCVVSMFFIVPSFMFAVNRLILHPKPPEVEKRK